jgi:hypothetical protein
MKFITNIWHPNVYPNGDVCISILHPPGDDATNPQETAAMRWNPIHTVFPPPISFFYFCPGKGRAKSVFAARLNCLSCVFPRLFCVLQLRASNFSYQHSLFKWLILREVMQECSC